ncbi:MAG: hypothetical protein FWF95_03415 [Syntrophorhabdaceae bacterium]|nr:hypothetical protein [Syntrophorhabdaceae bacterium]
MIWQAGGITELLEHVCDTPNICKGGLDGRGGSPGESLERKASPADAYLPLI